MQNWIVRIKPNRARALRAPPTPVRTWAEQHAPLAQIIGAYSTLAAVVVAGLGYWFTVIPLYQKAAVDEQLAKREAELKQLDVNLANARREAYQLVRSSLLEQTALRASYDCAAFWRQGGGTPVERISQSLKSCLLKASESIVTTKRLNEEDGRKLMLTTDEFATDWEQRRLAVLEKITHLPSTAASDANVLAPAGQYTKRVEEFLAQVEPYLKPEDRAARAQKRFDDRVRQTQLVMASDFGVQANAAIVGFYRSGIWPAIKLTE